MIVSATSKRMAVDKALLHYQDKYKKESYKYKIASVERQGLRTYEVKVRRV